jgi:hypothetical protein
MQRLGGSGWICCVRPALIMLTVSKRDASQRLPRDGAAGRAHQADDEPGSAEIGDLPPPSRDGTLQSSASPLLSGNSPARYRGMADGTCGLGGLNYGELWLSDEHPIAAEERRSGDEWVLLRRAEEGRPTQHQDPTLRI